MKRYCIFIVSALTICACASQSMVTHRVDPDTTSATSTPRNGIVLSAIEDAQISAGECGMLLWMLDDDRIQPIFQFTSGGDAQIMHYGALEKLVLVQSTGLHGFGVHQDQEFKMADGSVMKVSVSFGQQFDGGRYLDRGLITIESSLGLRNVIPTAGIAGCRG